MNEDWRELLEDLLEDDSDKMTAWEVEFIESVENQRKRNTACPGDDWEPSEKQQAVLGKIWHKVFG